MQRYDLKIELDICSNDVLELLIYLIDNNHEFPSIQAAQEHEKALKNLRQKAKMELIKREQKYKINLSDGFKTYSISEACEEAMKKAFEKATDTSDCKCAKCEHEDASCESYPCCECEEMYETMFEEKKLSIDDCEEQEEFNKKLDAACEELGERLQGIKADEIYIKIDNEYECGKAYEALAERGYASGKLGFIYTLINKYPFYLCIDEKIKKIKNTTCVEPRIHDYKIYSFADFICEYIPELDGIKSKENTEDEEINDKHEQENGCLDCKYYHQFKGILLWAGYPGRCELNERLISENEVSDKCSSKEKICDKGLPKERTCANCKFGKACILCIECHYLPIKERKVETDFCSKWEKK
jgi:hypothetical protein